MADPLAEGTVFLQDDRVDARTHRQWQRIPGDVVAVFAKAGVRVLSV
ncbi:MAG: hypothetical protein ACYCRE_11105 [Acidobacteriaceae bacterium]